MTTPALTAGCALLAFSPALTLLFLLTYTKAQLIIIVTTSAFAFLLSTVLSSLLWLPVPASLRSSPYVLIPPSVVCQFLARAAFVLVYFRVEHAVESSVRRFERHHARQQRGGTDTDGNDDGTSEGRGAGAGGSGSGSGGGGGDDDASANNGRGPPALSESAKLRLALNDWSSALAAGTGFGGFHAVMLYGTLLASESGNLGTLYQPSCSVMPSLVNSATMAFLYSICDVFWMLFTFYGMRRRRDAVEIVGNGNGGGPISFDVSHNNAGVLGRFKVSNDKRGGNVALLLSIVTHFCAGFATVPNAYDDGCLVALPVLAGVTIMTGMIFWFGVAGHYLPNAQRRRIWERTASMAAEAGGAAVGSSGARVGRYED